MTSKQLLTEALSSNIPQGKAGKTAYYSRLYTQHKVWMVRHVMKFGVSEADAEEVIQEAFVRLLRLDDDSTHSYLRSYLQRIATNIAIDRFRRKQRSPEIQLSEEEHSQKGAHQLSPERIEESREILLALQQSLKSLPQKCQDAFILYKVEGQSYQEVAERLNVSESMIRKYVLRALRHSYNDISHLL